MAFSKKVGDHMEDNNSISLEPALLQNERQLSASGLFSPDPYTQGSGFIHFPGVSTPQHSSQFGQLQRSSAQYDKHQEIQNFTHNQSYNLRDNSNDGQFQYNDEQQQLEGKPIFSRSGHPTLGQMAEQVQAKARAEAKSKQQIQQELYNRTNDEDDGEFDNGTGNGTERAGRWTKEEHELFLDALKKYGKEWKKVAAQVKTRTVVQTRTHAQKYFQKIHKSGPDDTDVIMTTGSSLKTSKRPRRGVGGGGNLSDDYISDRKRNKSQQPLSDEDEDDDYDEDNISVTDSVTSAVGQITSLGSQPINATPSTMSMSITIPTQSHRQTLNSNYFPQPSPAACGSRKFDELAAAEMLAGTATHDIDGVQMLVGLRTGGYPSSESHRSDHIYTTPGLVGTTGGSGTRNRSMPSLSIINPDSIGVFAHEDTPETPWEGELKALSKTETVFGSYSSMKPPTSTPFKDTSQATLLLNSEEMKRLSNELKEHIVNVDVNNILNTLKTMETVAYTITATNHHNNSNNNSSSINNNADGNSGNSLYLEAPDVSCVKTELSANNPFPNLLPNPEIKRNPMILSPLLNQKDYSNCGVTCLMIVCEVLDPSKTDETVVFQICNLLVEYGASVIDVDAQGWTCLHRSARFGYTSIGKLLLNKGCNVNAVGPNGDAATHIAAKAGHEKFLSLLISSGANPHIRNVQGQSALDLVGIDIIVSSTSNFNTNIPMASSPQNNLNSINNPSKGPILSSNSVQVQSQEYNTYISLRSQLRQMMLQTEPRLRTLILYHEDCLAHVARQATDWEQPDRLVEIMKKLRDSTYFTHCELEITSSFKKAGVEILSRAHSAEYITFVNELSKMVHDEYSNNNSNLHNNSSDGGIPKPPILPFTPQVQKFIKHFSNNEVKAPESCDTAFSAGTLRAARRAAGAVAHAIDMILLGRNRNAFCVIRPPGHHAGYSGLLDGGKSCGFCIFNNVAAGALHALEFHKVERVAIIDLDIHHGNGTEDIVRRYGQPSRLFFFSLHLYDKDASAGVAGYEFFPGSGAADDTTHNIINVPLSPIWSHSSHNTGVHHGTRNSKPILDAAPPAVVGRESYRQAVSQRLLPSLRAFNPDLILLSTGIWQFRFDPAQGDVGNVKFFSPTVGSTSTASHTNNGPERGMDLTAADFEWVTTEILRVADLCCSGRVVSVLEGGYGEYAKPSKSSSKHRAHNHTGTTSATDEDINSLMDRNVLGNSAVAHVRRLVDPYGPSLAKSNYSLSSHHHPPRLSKSNSDSTSSSESNVVIASSLPT